MLRKTIHATLIVILMMGAASAQERPHVQGMPGYSNAERSDAEKKTTKILIAPTNRRLRGVRMQKKI